jgi:acyl-CoA synthetase (AMP-forming)/AMP-acid ligase II
VVLSHRAFAGKLRAIDERLHLAEGARSLLVLQITFSYGVWFSLLTLLKGGTLFMRPKFEAAAVLSAMVEDGITEAAFVPTMLRGFLALPGSQGPRRDRLSPDLRRLCTGGEPLPAALGRAMRDLFGGRGLVDIYGLTETCTCDFFVQTEEQDMLAGTIGRPSPGVAFRIMGGDGLPVAPGEIGELQIRSPFVMNGYLDQPELTAAAFQDGFFRTGDLARQRPDGAVELVGRAKEIVSRGGNKIAPLEIDAVVCQHPAVAGALSTGLPDPLLGERLHLMVVPRAGAIIDEGELRAWLAARLERYKLPDGIHFADALPLGRTGKVDRGRLREMLVDNERGAAR